MMKIKRTHDIVTDDINNEELMDLRDYVESGKEKWVPIEDVLKALEKTRQFACLESWCAPKVKGEHFAYKRGLNNE